MQKKKNQIFPQRSIRALYIGNKIAVEQSVDKKEFVF